MDHGKCFDEFKKARKIVVLTGAGVSTFSGIPDFRGPEGAFRRKWHGYDVEELLDSTFFERSPDLFYAYARENWYPMTFREPSIVHLTLAAMEKNGMLDVLYTQNIDLLHTRAGSRHVMELHGSFRTHRCLSCGREFGLEPVRETVMRGEVPHCPGCGGLIKPGVVFYGDPLDEELLHRAFRDFESADLVLVLGSSLTVAPVSSLPMATRGNGGTIIIVNEQPTDYDAVAGYRFHDLRFFCTALAARFPELAG